MRAIIGLMHVVALLQNETRGGPGGPQILAITIIAVVILAVVWGIGFAWGRNKRDKKRYCPSCNRELKQPEGAPRCAYCGTKLF